MKQDKMIDAEKLFDKNGLLDEDYMKLLVEKKPIIPSIKPNHHQRFFSIKENRDRSELPERLPTNGLSAFPVDAHEQIGEYETKHNLYLITANAYNKLMERIEKLEGELEMLKKSK